MVFGSGFEVEHKFKFSELQRNLGCWRNPEQSHDSPLAISNADTPFILLTRQPGGRGDSQWVLFACRKSPIEFWLQICRLLEQVTCMEWRALNGWWCDSPGWSSVPSPNGLNFAWCEKKAGHLLPRGDQSPADYSRDCQRCEASRRFIQFYDIPPLSFIIWNGSKTFHGAAVSRACGCETAAAVDERPGAAVQTDDRGNEIAGIRFDSNSKQTLEARRGSIHARRATSPLAPAKWRYHVNRTGLVRHQGSR